LQLLVELLEFEEELPDLDAERELLALSLALSDLLLLLLRLLVVFVL